MMITTYTPKRGERYNHFVVQTSHGISQFSELWIARKHAELNRPARIWRGQDVRRIEARNLHVALNSTPIEETN